MMKRPPNGIPITARQARRFGDCTDIMKQLRETKRCTQRLLTDGGHHMIFCGGYFHGETTLTGKGYRCKHHA